MKFTIGIENIYYILASIASQFPSPLEFLNRRRPRREGLPWHKVTARLTMQIFHAKFWSLKETRPNFVCLANYEMINSVAMEDVCMHANGRFFEGFNTNKSLCWKFAWNNIAALHPPDFTSVNQRHAWINNEAINAWMNLQLLNVLPGSLQTC